MAIKFEHEESIYDLGIKILEKSKSRSVTSLLYYLMRSSEYGILRQESAFDTEGWDSLFEDDQLLGTKYSYYDEHNKRVENQWYAYAVIEDNILLKISVIDEIGHFYFKVLDNADQYIVKTTTDFKGKQRITIFDGKGKVFGGEKNILIQPEVLPETIKLVDIVRPVNLNDLVDKVLSKTK